MWCPVEELTGLARPAGELCQRLERVVEDWPEALWTLGDALEAEAQQLLGAVDAIDAATQDAKLREPLWLAIGLTLGIEALLERADDHQVLGPEEYTRLDQLAVALRARLNYLARELDDQLYGAAPAPAG